jgi:50S ribosomal subunit-associated GTPase HflX
VVLTKADLLPAADHAAVVAGLDGARLISAHTGQGMRELLEELWKLIAAQVAAERAGDE